MPRSGAMAPATTAPSANPSAPPTMPARSASTYFIGGPIGGLVGLVVGGVIALRRFGHRGFAAIGGRLALVVAGVAGVGAAIVAAFWIARPIVNANGPAPQLVFEIRLPAEVTPPSIAGYSIELQTSKNRMPGT